MMIYMCLSCQTLITFQSSLNTSVFNENLKAGSDLPPSKALGCLWFLCVGKTRGEGGVESLVERGRGMLALVEDVFENKCTAV
jgi:hypothetical protein